MEYNTTWESPSNIALVKYWGKKIGGIQWPANASISFTLSHCKTSTQLTFFEGEPLEIEVLLDQKKVLNFIPKITQFFERVASIYPFVLKGRYEIQTSNTFPHSSGIASSASGMSALALCICDIAKSKGLLKEDDFFRQASILARLGSGSASRSVYGPMAVWGKHQTYSGSDDDFAIAFTDIAPIFRGFCDTILLVHKGQKTVSSSVGHNLINNHPFSANRFDQATEHMSDMQHILQAGDLVSFVSLVEREALTLHSLMMSSDPYFILMKPNTLKIIEAIWEKRQKDGVLWCFTLDAGANVHFLYPQTDKAEAILFVETTLKQYCENGAFIHDQVGLGPQKV
ncbi:diphosphomevalonate decarboxylase [Bacteroidia bacterium]|nr:diphosphomevalonate decarboxylase [Bacteroidia bacterium]